MPETAPELLAADDDLVFEPSCWDLAMTIELRADPMEHREVLDELADAMLVGAEGPEAERLVALAARSLWDEELARSIRDGLMRVRELGPEWLDPAEVALEELDLLGCRSEIAGEVTAHLALQLSQLDHPWTLCVHCIDEALARIPPGERRPCARQVAVVARRNVAVSDEEARAALVAGASQRPEVRLATDERRRAIRERLVRVGRLGRGSLPHLSEELEAIGAEPVPERPEDDDVWQEVVACLLADVARPMLTGRGRHEEVRPGAAHRA
jgi:hypothetical protein